MRTLQLAAVILVLVSFAAATANATGTTQLFTKADFAAMPKGELVNVAYSLQQRVLIDEAGSATEAPLTAIPIASTTNEQPAPQRHRSVLGGVMVAVAGALVMSAVSAHYARTASYGLPAATFVARPRILGRMSLRQPAYALATTASSSVPAPIASAMPSNNNTFCTALTAATTAANVFFQGINGNAKYANTTPPSPPATPTAEMVRDGKNQRGIAEAGLTFLGAIGAARNCGNSGTATVTPVAAPTSASGSLPHSTPYGSIASNAATTPKTQQVVIAPAPRQAFCNTASLLTNSFASNGSDWLDRSDPGKNVTYYLVYSLLGSTPPWACGGLQPTVNQVPSPAATP